MKLHQWLYLIFIVISIQACCSSRPQSPCYKTSNKKTKTQAKLPKVKKSILEIRGGHYLEDLHPRLKKMAHILYEKTESIGIEIRFISGYRKYRTKKKIKKNGSWASWHNVGLAFDINLVGRKGMKDALNHWSDDQEDWRTIGKIAKKLGLTWGLPWGKSEVFHFEWHPGYPDAIRKKTFRILQNKAGSQLHQYTKVWNTIQ